MTDGDMAVVVMISAAILRSVGPEHFFYKTDQQDMTVVEDVGNAELNARYTYRSLRASRLGRHLLSPLAGCC